MKILPTKRMVSIVAVVAAITIIICIFSAIQSIKSGEGILSLATVFSVAVTAAFVFVLCCAQFFRKREDVIAYTVTDEPNHPEGGRLLRDKFQVDPDSL